MASRLYKVWLQQLPNVNFLGGGTCPNIVFWNKYESTIGPGMHLLAYLLSYISYVIMVSPICA